MCERGRKHAKFLMCTSGGKNFAPESWKAVVEMGRDDDISSQFTSSSHVM
jgi:hypothetical protein